MDRIDVHAHAAGDTEESAAFFSRLGVRLLNVSLATDRDGKWRQEPMVGSVTFREMAGKWPDRFAWCTAFDLPRFDDPHYADRVIAELDRDFAAGAVAVKVWKNVGLVVRKAGGEYMLPDDPILDPILEHIERKGRTLFIHAGEPIDAWLPLDRASLHYGYFSTHPAEHLHGKGVPGHGEVMAARDRMVGTHPKLRVVGCHVLSMEKDLKAVAERLDRHPNLALDTAARLMDVARHGGKAVREFMTKYKDRVMWATDLFAGKRHSEMTVAERKVDMAELERHYGEEFGYYGGKGEMELKWFLDSPMKVEGPGLPADVLDAFFAGNARRLVPGLFGGK